MKVTRGRKYLSFSVVLMLQLQITFENAISLPAHVLNGIVYRFVWRRGAGHRRK